MCGRVRLQVPFREIARLLRCESVFGLDVLGENIAPTDLLPVVHLDGEGRRVLSPMRWGLIPSWAKEPLKHTFNARIETIEAKPAFRKARRCLVVADAFYEWSERNGKRLPNVISPRDRQPFAMAGLCDVWTSPDGEVIDSCTIVTTAAEGSVAALHDRMPLVLPEASQEEWLRKGTGAEGLILDFFIEPIAVIPGKAPPRQLGLFG